MKATDDKTLAQTEALLGADMLSGAFENFPGPVLRLREDATFEALNSPAQELSDRLNGEDGVTVLPSVVQLAVKSRSEGRARTRTFSMPHSDQQIEFVMLPQADGTQLMIGRDTTLELSIRTALAESRTRYKELLEIAADFAWETDQIGRLSFVSAKGALGYTPEELLGQQPEMLLMAPETAPSPLPFSATEAVEEVEIWMNTRAGEPACLTVSAVPILGDDGTHEGTRGIAMDVTGDRFRRTELARLKLRDRLIQHVVDALRTVADPDEMLNAAGHALLNAAASDGCVIQVDGPRHAIPLQSIEIGEGPDSVVTVEILETSAASGPGLYDGKIGVWRYLCAITDYRGDQNGSVLLWRHEQHGPWDADEPAVLNAVVPQMGVVFRQIVDQRNLDILTRTDPVTGLYNRKAFMEDLAREVARTRRYGNRCALLMIDVSSTRAGTRRLLDERLALKVAEIVTAETRTYDLACRLEEDVFAVWLDNADAMVAKTRGSGFIQTFAAWKEDAARRHFLTLPTGSGFAIGVALFSPARDDSIDGVMTHAEAAMKAAAGACQKTEEDSLMMVSDGEGGNEQL